jgi:PKD repeat protein
MGVYTKVNYNQINFTTLAEGDYRADFTFGSYNSSKTFHINGIHIVASIEASAVLVPMYQNIDFSAVVSHANHYSWDFGDGTLVEGVANPNLAYYEPGVYTVQLNTSNDNGCTATAQITITVLLASGIKEQDNKEAAIKLNGRTLNINLNENAANAEVKVFNMIGQPVYTSVLTTSISTFDLNVESNGYYVVSVKNAGKTSSKRIFITK